MKGELLLLARLELCNLFGLNVQRHSTDRSAKRRWRLQAAAFALLGLMGVGYASGLVFGLVALGLEEIVVAYLATLLSLVILCFDCFRAGPLIFSKKGYDLLASLPLSTRAIVLSRFLRMYAEDLLLSALLLLPGFGLYAVLTGPGVWFYPTALAAMLLLPAIPLVIATMIGTAISAAASRMRHKALAQSGLTLGSVLALMAASYSMVGLDGRGFTLETLAQMGEAIGETLNLIYPPAAWLGKAVEGDPLALAGFCLVSLAVLAAMTALVSRVFHATVQRLFSNSATHSYRLTQLPSTTLGKALVLRELRRYFSSTIYVTNTILGPILAVFFAGSVYFAGSDAVQSALELPFDLSGIVPFLFTGIFTMMTTTACSVSMEGKEFWIVQSLPISTKSLMDGKLLMNLLLMAPCWLVGQGFLWLA